MKFVFKAILVSPGIEIFVTGTFATSSKDFLVLQRGHGQDWHLSSTVQL